MELNDSKHLDPSKVELLCLANELYQLKSLCDIGGVWGVEGGYSIYAKSVLGIPDVTLIDSHWTEESRVLCRHSGVEIEENFLNLSKVVCDQQSWGAVCLFHFLLHQVSPDWREILRILSNKVTCFLINNPQWIKDKTGFRLLDLGVENYFSFVPHDKSDPSYKKILESPFEIDEFHQKANRDLHHIWQWAITNDDLIDCMKALGFHLVYMRPSGVWDHNENFQDFGFIFEKTNEPRCRN